MKKQNVFSPIPSDIPDEIFETIAASGTVRIERIVSRGQATPQGSWYDEELAEWVILLKGSADILFEGEATAVTLLPGDHILIPPHRRHRVTRTDDEAPTIWVAVYFADT
ncbi:MAG TPA: cupin domain-containing protein [Syntrophorhabdaceae bacterium]|nr:cupin domain-containing protein [Syntrophorhabdaceae bacterium]